MDLRRHLAVVARFWWAPALGLLVGAAIAVLATWHVPGFTPRQAERSTSTSRLFVTQPDFPWGKVVPGGASASDASARYADLAIVYSFLLQGAPVLKQVPLPPGAEIGAQALRDGTGGNATPLPFVEITALARRPSDAPALNARAIDALRAYLRARQTEDGVPGPNRVVLQVLQPPSRPVLTERRSYAGAAVALALCVLLGLLAAYVLEDLLPRGRSRVRGADDRADPARASDALDPRADDVGADPVGAGAR